jgi:ABC-2 family transporter protein
MMLLRKELGALRFWWLFILLLEVIGFGMTAMTSFIDSDPLSPEDHQKNASSILVFTIVIGFGSVATAFGHERDQDTQRFLDALPVSPARAFFTKLLASYLTVMGWHIIDLGTSVISGALSLTTVSPALPWQYLGGMLGVSAVHGLAVVGVGSVLAFARRWYASFVGLLVWFGLWIRFQDAWWASVLDGVELLSPELKDGRITALSWIPLAGHLGAGAVGMTLGLVLYAGREGWFTRWVQGCLRIRLTRWVIKLSPLAAVAVWVGVVPMIQQQHQTEDGEESAGSRGDQVVAADGKDSGGSLSVFQHHETRSCEFLFRASQRPDAERLWAVADQVCEEALDAFGGQGRWKGRLVVDLSSPVASHAAAQTDWTKIRFPIDRHLPTKDRPHVLRHEVTHVIIEQLSDGQALRHFDAMRAFHEGMATYVETQSSQPGYPQQERAREEKSAALAWSRGAVPLDDVLNAAQLARHRDEFLVYPLGLVWVETLIKVGGVEMPALLLQALRAKPPKPGLVGREVWRHLFAQTGHSWERAEAVFENRMAELVKQHQRLIDQLPRLSAQVKEDGATWILQPDPMKKPAAGFVMICMVKPRFGILQPAETLAVSADGSFRLTQDLQAKGRLLYMLGWRHEREKIHVFEPWTALTP